MGRGVSELKYEFFVTINYILRCVMQIRLLIASLNNVGTNYIISESKDMNI